VMMLSNFKRKGRQSDGKNEKYEDRDVRSTPQINESKITAPRVRVVRWP